ncbi:Hypothetical predicted protein, partial [Olea europaea subsp. europaea]
MSRPYSDPKLLTYTKLLKHRIAHLGHIDFNFMHSYEAELPKSYSDHLGRLFGWFILTDERPGIILLGRERIGGDISHAFLFYVNSTFEEYPLEERRYLARKLSPEPKLCIQNIRTTVGQYCEFAVLME